MVGAPKCPVVLVGMAVAAHATAKQQHAEVARSIGERAVGARVSVGVLSRRPSGEIGKVVATSTCTCYETADGPEVYARAQDLCATDLA